MLIKKEEGVDPVEALGAGWEEVTADFAFAEKAGLTVWQKQPKRTPATKEA